MPDLRSCIYIIKSKMKPERFYVGSAVRFYHRKAGHICSLKKLNHKNSLLQRHVNKYGIDDIYFEVLEYVPNKKDLITREQFFIDSLNPFFNLSKTAGSSLGVVTSSETKQKLRELNTGKKQSSETIQKRMTTFFLNGSIESMRKKKKGKKLSDEHKKKISLGNKGKKHAPHTQRKRTLQHCINIGLGNKGKKVGIKLSEAHRKKISDSTLGRKMTQESINKRQASRLKNAVLRNKKY